MMFHAAIYAPVAAKIYDELSGAYARKIAAWIASRPKPEDASIIDIGCGTGTLIRTLERTGWTCLGVDSSRAMVLVARSRVRASAIRLGDACAFTSPTRVSCVTAFGDVANHLQTKTRLRAFLSCAHKALRPDGELIIDSLNPSDINSNWATYLEYTHSPTWRLIRVGRRIGPGQGELRYEYFSRARAGHWTLHTEIHRLTAWSASELGAELRASGFNAIKFIDAETLHKPTPKSVRWLIIARRSTR